MFEGNDHEVNITGNSDWEGLFKINGSSGLSDAPAIHNVHIIGGETSITGGFVVQSGQKHFIVESCSSTGVIKRNGGGICGEDCSGDVLITNSWSTGKILGARAGGIAGRQFGHHGDGNTVNISHCHSTGDIAGDWSGGICGHRVGHEDGKVTIVQSYSTGKIKGFHSGGICARAAGHTHGKVVIEQCSSLGEISGQGSGGITGAFTAHIRGHVSITNCFSREDITGSGHAGGICGYRTGSAPGGHGHVGTVMLTNVYASGNITDDDAGGLIGEIDTEAKNISITMSVYNGNTGDIIGGDKGATSPEKNSGNLHDITGSVYCYDGDRPESKECWDDEKIWQIVGSDFPILQGVPFSHYLTPSTSPRPTETSTPSLTSRPTSSNTGSQTPSSSQILKPKRIVFTQLLVQRPRRRVVNK